MDRALYELPVPARNGGRSGRKAGESACVPCPFRQKESILSGGKVGTGYFFNVPVEEWRMLATGRPIRRPPLPFPMSPGDRRAGTGSCVAPAPILLNKSALGRGGGVWGEGEPLPRRRRPKGGRRPCLLGHKALQASTAERGGPFPPDGPIPGTPQASRVSTESVCGSV